MIYTITFNPALDYIICVDRLELGRTNRTTEECMLPGGKGINVSTVLMNLGIPSTALGFTAGFTGEELSRRVEELGIRSDFIRIADGATRINVKLKDYDGTEINGMGPRIDDASMRKLMEKLRALKGGDTLILAGSIPSGVPGTIYRDILKELSERNRAEGSISEGTVSSENGAAEGIRFVVDAAGELLLDVLPYHPFLIKPNNHELAGLFGLEESALVTRESVVPFARKLKELGAENVLVSMAGEGAVLLDENGDVHMHDAPKGKLVNAVGAGDSMVAGFLAGYEKFTGSGTADAAGEQQTACGACVGSTDAIKAAAYNRYEQAFRMGIAAGSASAFSERLAAKSEILSLYRTL